MSAYEDLLARSPKSTQAGDTKAAAAFVSAISQALQTDAASFNEAQRTYLYRLRSKWQSRAEGRDARWNVMGSRPGRPPVDESKKTSAPRRRSRPDPGESTPLFRSLMQKYSKPRDPFQGD